MILKWIVTEYWNEICINLLKQGQSSVCWTILIAPSMKKLWFLSYVNTTVGCWHHLFGDLFLRELQVLCAAMMSLPPNDVIILLKIKINVINLSSSLKVTSERWQNISCLWYWWETIYLHNYKTSNVTGDIQILLLNSFFFLCLNTENDVQQISCQSDFDICESTLFQ